MNKIQLQTTNNEVQPESILTERAQYNYGEGKNGPEPISKYIIGIPNPHRAS